MSKRSYNGLANILLLLGIASAVLFDSGLFPRLLTGFIGIIAGVAAVALYFWNQKPSAARAENGTSDEDRPKEHVVPATLLSDSFEKSTKVSGENVAFLDTGVLNHWAAMVAYERDLIRSRKVVWRRKEIANNLILVDAVHHARALQWYAAKAAPLELLKPEVEMTPAEVAACAVEIIRRMSSLDIADEWDYDLNAWGLKVTLKKSKPSMPIIPQEDFDFMSSQFIQ